MARTPLLVISGPVGVGKTTVANEVGATLERTDVAHTVIDLDMLAATYPRPPDDPFGSRLASKNLHDVWANSAAAGSRNLIVARVVETARELNGICSAIPNSSATVCRLRASDRTLAARVRSRELGAGCDWHIARSLELARSLRNDAPADFTVDTDGRSVPDIAEEIAARIAWVADG